MILKPKKQERKRVFLKNINDSLRELAILLLRRNKRIAESHCCLKELLKYYWFVNQNENGTATQGGTCPLWVSLPSREAASATFAASPVTRMLITLGAATTVLSGFAISWSSRTQCSTWAIRTTGSCHSSKKLVIWLYKKIPHTLFCVWGNFYIPKRFSVSAFHRFTVLWRTLF